MSSYRFLGELVGLHETENSNNSGINKTEACFFFFFFSYVMRSLVAGVALVAAGVRAKMSAILWALFSRPKEGRRDKSKVQK